MTTLDAATLAWEDQLTNESSKTTVRQSAQERQQHRESIGVFETLEFDALDFSAVVKNTKEDDNDI